MIYKTIHPLPFVEVILRTGYQDDLELDALCVFVRVPSVTIRLAVLTTCFPCFIQPSPTGGTANLAIDAQARDDGLSEKLVALLEYVQSLPHEQDSACQFTAMIAFLRGQLSIFGDVTDWPSLSGLLNEWGSAMDRWNAVVDPFGDIIPEHADDANALLQLTINAPTPPGPLRASEAMHAFSAFLMPDEYIEQVAKLIAKFCETHELEPIRHGYLGLLHKFTDSPPDIAITAVARTAPLSAQH